MKDNKKRTFVIVSGCVRTLEEYKEDKTTGENQ